VYLYSAVGPEWVEGSDVGEYDFYYVPQNMFEVPTFWLVAALVSAGSFFIFVFDGKINSNNVLKACLVFIGVYLRILYHFSPFRIVLFDTSFRSSFKISQSQFLSFC
jgi:hypothetical protein